MQFFFRFQKLGIHSAQRRNCIALWQRQHRKIITENNDDHKTLFNSFYLSGSNIIGLERFQFIIMESFQWEPGLIKLWPFRNLRTLQCLRYFIIYLKGKLLKC